MKFQLLALAAAALIGVGCSSPSADGGASGGVDDAKPVAKGDGGAAKSGLKIAMIPKGTTHEFWKSVHAGADEAAKALGVELIWKGPLKEDDREAQIQVVENFTTQGVNGICVAPLDDKALRKPVDEALKAKIPIVVFDSGLADASGTVSLVATDNKKGGSMAGEAMAKDLGKGGKVILMRYQEGSASTMLREEGFLEAAKAGGLELISADQFAGATTESAMKTAENLLNRFKDQVQGIFCPNESSTAGMLKVLQDLKLAGKVKFYGFDASAKLVDGLKSGEINGLVVQNPFNMGKLAIESMVKAINGEKVDERIDTGATLATKENMETPDVAKVLNPPKL